MQHEVLGAVRSLKQSGGACADLADAVAERAAECLAVAFVGWRALAHGRRVASQQRLGGTLLLRPAALAAGPHASLHMKFSSPPFIPSTYTLQAESGRVVSW